MLKTHMTLAKMALVIARYPT
ncbi:hypothetical protein RCCS2_05604 [Roseobacter sp. CCS2]|nr:hypothetical protein RCCS2_05604 [Roseobacter sp. CCS2]